MTAESNNRYPLKSVRSIERRDFLRASGALLASPILSRAISAEQSEPRSVCPKSKPPARVLHAMLLEDLRTYGWDLRLTLTCLQGIVNRSQPRLYLVQDNYDRLWLDWLRKRGDVDEVQWLEVGDVIKRYLPETRVMFLADRKMPATVNAATMLAGIYGGLVATPRTARLYRLPMGNNPDRPEDGLDLTRLGWKKNLDAYRWVFDRVGRHLSRRAVCYLAPWDIPLRDYLVEFKIPIVWVSAEKDTATSPTAEPAEEKQFAREVFMKWPPNIPCLGWPDSRQELGCELGIGEVAGVDLGSDCAKFQICSAWDGYSATTSNVSVHSGTTAVLRQKKAAKVPLDRNKVYFSFVRSDGDGWNFHRDYYRKLFDDPQHGRFPLAWQVGPHALDAIPDIIDYYYQHATPNDYFVNALTGIGYIHEQRYAQNYPPAEREEILRQYMRLSASYLKRLDTEVLVTYAEMRPELLEQFASIQGVKGICANYGRCMPCTTFPVETTLKNVLSEVAGVPVFRAVTDHQFGIGTFTPAMRADYAAFLAKDIKTWTPPYRPAFLHAFVGNPFTHMEIGEEIIKTLGPEYVAVRPDQLAALYRESRR